MRGGFMFQLGPFYGFLISVGIMQVGVFLTTMYLHRSLTHRSLEFRPWVACLMHAYLMMFTGISPREWVAVHRKHHEFPDREGDPHSPYLLGLWHVLFGNVIYYRRAAGDAAVVRKYTADYKPTLVDRIPFLNGWGVVLGAALFVVAFGFGWGIVLFMFQAVGYVMLNASINSICHMIGYRNFDNLATNNTVIAWMTGGEGLHNNHHECQTSAHFAMKPGEVDPAWPVIRIMERLGLVVVRKTAQEKAA